MESDDYFFLDKQSQEQQGYRAPYLVGAAAMILRSHLESMVAKGHTLPASPSGGADHGTGKRHDLDFHFKT